MIADSFDKNELGRQKMLSDENRRLMYGESNTLRRQNPYLIDANYDKHTMKGHILAYMGIELRGGYLTYSEKKFSLEQWEYIQDSRHANCNIRVFGAWRSDVEFLASKFEFEIIESGRLFKREAKVYNRHRNQFFKVQKIGGDKREFEIWVFVFPSKEYVDQVAELLAAIVQEMNRHEPRRKCITQVYVEHFDDLESGLCEWTGFNEAMIGFVWHGDVVTFGNIDDFGKGLVEGGFSQVGKMHSYGLSKMFGVRIFHSNNNRARLVQIGFVECFWGSAISHYVTSLMKLGARHLLYGSKAATMDNVDAIHQVRSPNGFSLVESYDRNIAPATFELTAKLEALCKIYGITSTGISVTVPTVMSESAALAKLLSTKGSVNMDCENGHIAKAVKSFNDSNGFDGTNDGRRARFVAVHFVTDYIYQQNEKVVGNK
jgi:hypothetical protein